MKGSSVMDVDAKNEFSFPFRAVCLQILFLYLDHVVPAGPWQISSWANNEETEK